MATGDSGTSTDKFDTTQWTTLASDSFDKVKTLINLDSIRKEREWNPPTPDVFQGREDLTMRGWIVPDPMPVTGYALAKATDGAGSTTATTTSTGGTNNASGQQGQPSSYAKNNLGIDEAPGAVKYGFRFHFNPTEYSEMYSNTSGVDPIGFLRMLHQRDLPVMSKQTGATGNVELLLSRVDDIRILRRPDYQDYYTAGTFAPRLPITDEQRDEILSRGTMADLEYLFRVINGKRWKTWWSTYDTADWGIFLPRPVIISVGDYEHSQRFRVLVSSMSINHVVFAPGMVPVITTVSMSLERLFDNMDKGVEWSEGEADTRGVGRPAYQTPEPPPRQKSEAK